MAPSSSVPARRLGPAFAGYLIATLLMGSLIGWILIALEPHLPEEIRQSLFRKGPEKVVRRAMLISALVLFPWIWSRLGYRGREDWAWRNALSPSIASPLLRGVVWGLLSLGGVMLLSLVLGPRIWNPAYPAGTLVLKSLFFFLSAGVVAMVEETLVRGILFHTMSRHWGWVGAAVVSGLIFAWAHFISPSAEALAASGWMKPLAIAGSSVTGFVGVEDSPARFANLFLMSLVLCAATRRTGTIWMAVGLHASWVWVKKVNAIVSDSMRDSPWTLWVGARSDHIDSILVAVLMLVMLTVLLLPVSRPEPAP